MTTWFTEHPTGAYIVIAGIAVVFLIATAATRRVKFLLGAALAGLAAGGVWLTDYLVVTDREQVELNVQDMIHAVEKHDVNQFCTHVSDDFQIGNISKTGIRTEGERVFKGIRKVNLANLRVEPSSDQRVMKAEFSVSPTGTAEGVTLDSQTFWVKLSFEKDPDGKWRAMQAEVFDALGQNRLWPR